VTYRRPRYLAPSIVIIALIVLVAALAACGPSRAEQCRDNGGTVQVDRNIKKKTTEYECIKDGQEIDEWK
jgi:hypothetical protein